LQVFYSYIGRPPTTHEFGVQRLPGGRGPGGTGDFYLGSIEGPNSIQETRRYPVNALNQYNIVVLTQKYSYPQALRTITKNEVKIVLIYQKMRYMNSRDINAKSISSFKHYCINA
jgi:hypothetical protein